MPVVMPVPVAMPVHRQPLPTGSLIQTYEIGSRPVHTAAWPAVPPHFKHYQLLRQVSAAGFALQFLIHHTLDCACHVAMLQPCAANSWPGASHALCTW